MKLKDKMLPRRKLLANPKSKEKFKNTTGQRTEVGTQSRFISHLSKRGGICFLGIRWSPAMRRLSLYT